MCLLSLFLIHCLLSLDEIQNTSKVCSPNDLRQEEEEAVETTFPVLRIEHCDISLNVGVEKYR